MKSMMRQQMLETFSSPNHILHACIRDDDIGSLRQRLQTPNIPNLIEQRDYTFGTPLCVAVWCECLPAVRLLLGAGADPIAAISDDEILSPLLLAIRLGNKAIVQPLWAQLEDKNYANGSRSIPSCAYQAAYYGHATLVGDLLTWWDGWTDIVKEEALHAAASRWHIHVVDLMLKRLNFPLNVINKALHRAADFKPMMGDEERSGVKYNGVDYTNQELLVTRIIKAGADPNTPLRGHYVLNKVAISANLASALKALLENGADPNIPSQEDNGQTVLHILGSPVPFQYGTLDGCCLYETGICLLLEHGGSVLQADLLGNTPLHCVAFGANERIFNIYLSARPESFSIDQCLNVKNSHDETLLHWAAAGAKLDILRYLIFCGLDVNATSSTGWTPLICALAPTRESRFSGATKSLSDAIHAAQLLLFHGAKPGVSTDESWTPLHCLASHADADEEGEAAQLARLLVSQGTAVDAPATLLTKQDFGSAYSWRDQKALLHYEHAWGSEVRRLIDIGADRIGFARHGMTPLHWAASHGAVGVAKALLDLGANANAASPSGITPKQLAARAEHRRSYNATMLKERLIELLDSHNQS
ncbi:ankyrin repeat-containing domain protein [Mariannaea sp. PMI_226]|nr:ankyrin repeat-containing domain protein [Mariannaea sp. PMI_226]